MANGKGKRGTTIGLQELEAKLGLKFEWGLRVADVDQIPVEDAEDGGEEEPWTDEDASLLDADETDTIDFDMGADDREWDDSAFEAYERLAEARPDREHRQSDWAVPNPQSRPPRDTAPARERDAARSQARDAKQSGMRDAPPEQAVAVLRDEVQGTAKLVAGKAAAKPLSDALAALKLSSLSADLEGLVQQAAEAGSLDALEKLRQQVDAARNRIGAVEPFTAVIAWASPKAVPPFHRAGEIAQLLAQMETALDDESTLEMCCAKLGAILNKQRADRDDYASRLAGMGDLDGRTRSLKESVEELKGRKDKKLNGNYAALEKFRKTLRDFRTSGDYAAAFLCLVPFYKCLVEAEQRVNALFEEQNLATTAWETFGNEQNRFNVLIGRAKTAGLDVQAWGEKFAAVTEAVQGRIDRAIAAGDATSAVKAANDLGDFVDELQRAVGTARPATATGGGQDVFDPVDPTTWEIQAVDNRISGLFPGSAGSDHALLRAISRGEKGDRSTSTTVRTDVPMHQHCGGGRGGGSSGISFVYSHGTGRIVTPVIYDHGPKDARSNDFHWQTGGRSAGPAALPADI
jgi:hypothetical protein